MERCHVDSVIFLTPDLFTDSVRTPWAGKKIGETLKYEVDRSYSDRLIGESWELSCDKAFQSKCIRSGKTLESLIAEDPKSYLGHSYCQKFGETLKIIIKIVNSRMPLSFQVHPHNDYAKLRSGESAKTESWLVLDAEPGAGIYLGFNSSFTHQEIEAKIAQGSGALKALLQFVPVKKGDYFEIEPGTPHAIGEGVTLLEPQYVNRGSGGKTYRLWDWDRRYDATGDLDILGKSRELHLRQALELIDPPRQWGKEFIRSVKKDSSTEKIGPHIINEFSPNEYYRLYYVNVEKGSPLELNCSDSFAFMETLEGELSLDLQKKGFKLGQPMFKPGTTRQLRVSGKGKFAMVMPSTGHCQFKSNSEI